MDEKLKPCPFCRGEGQLQGMTPENGGDRRHFVHCRSCGADGPWFKVAASAVKGWNRRTPGPATAAIIEIMNDGPATRLDSDDDLVNGESMYLLRPEHVAAFVAEHEPAKEGGRG